MPVNDIIDKLRQDETTTSDAIAYIPSGFSTMSRALKTLSRMKKHWKIDIEEGEEQYRVRFDDNVLEVTVVKEHWMDFMQRVLGVAATPAKAFTLDIGQYLKEAKDEDLGKAGRELHTSLYSMLVKDPIKNAGGNISAWNNTFKHLRHSTGNNVLIRYEKMNDDVRALYNSLRKMYDDDLGTLELLSSALDEQRPLGTFEGFDQKEFLIGTRIESSHEGVPIAYETLVDMTFVPREHIVIQDQDVLDELEGTKGLKIATNTVFPTGKTFSPKHFKAVKDAIDDTIE